LLDSLDIGFVFFGGKPKLSDSEICHHFDFRDDSCLPFFERNLSDNSLNRRETLTFPKRPIADPKLVPLRSLQIHILVLVLLLAIAILSVEHGLSLINIKLLVRNNSVHESHIVRHPLVHASDHIRDFNHLVLNLLNELVSFLNSGDILSFLFLLSGIAVVLAIIGLFGKDKLIFSE
jgi:hypothetical protein